MFNYKNKVIYFVAKPGPHHIPRNREEDRMLIISIRIRFLEMKVCAKRVRRNIPRPSQRVKVKEWSRECEGEDMEREIIKEHI